MMAKLIQAIAFLRGSAILININFRVVAMRGEVSRGIQLAEAIYAFADLLNIPAVESRVVSFPFRIIEDQDRTHG
jgi:hypothetical protein